MREPMASDDAPSRPRRTARAVGRVSSRLAEGIPIGFVVALFALVLIAILFTVASREPAKPRGYAELTVGRGTCLIDAARQVNALGCRAVGPRAYRMAFSRSLKGSTPIAGRGSCCPGKIGATADTDRTVIIALDKRVKSPIRVSVLIP
jgi:hypothetical protein